MTQNASPSTSAGDPTPELTQASLIQAVTLLNKYGYNIEVPAAAVAGAIVMRRGVTIFPGLGAGAAPVQNDGYGAKFTLTHVALKTTLLQQSVNTNDERLYLLNNASPTAGGTFTGNFIYDKTGAAATYYVQAAGLHSFATAPTGGTGTPITFTERVKIDTGGLTVVAGNLSVGNGVVGVTNATGGDKQMVGIVNSGNSSSLSINSVAGINSYIQGSTTGDTAIRAETGNLDVGAQTGNTTIGTSTKTLARFNAGGSVVIPSTNGINATYGGMAVGSGLSLVVGAGSNVASDTKSLWIYNDPTVNGYNGVGMQLNAQMGIDFWVGNAAQTAWQRPLQVQNNGKVLVGGMQNATAIGDLHVNQIGADTSGSLSLTGLGGASYLLMGNRDSLGTAGPGMIVSANRQVQIGVGNSFVTRGGGSFVPVLTVDGTYACVGVNITNPNTYGPLAVNVTNGSAIAQVVVAANSPATLGANGTLAGGLGMFWGNNVFVGMKTVTGGDANNASLAFLVGNAGSSNEAGRFNTVGDFTVRGSTLVLGAATVAILGANASSDSYFRGNTISFQNAAATVTWLNITSTLITAQIDTNFVGNVTVGQTLNVNRVVEGMAERTSVNGTTVFDYNTSQQFYISSTTANFIPNFTNIPTVVNKIITLTLIVQQGATGYWPTALQINGAAATIKWAGGMAPVTTPNNIDVFQFSLIRTAAGTWIVLASATPYV